MDGRPTYWLTRFLILRLLGVIYAVAFLVAINQIIPLIGANGLLPVGIFLKRVATRSDPQAPASYDCHRFFGSSIPTRALLTAAWIGFLLSCVVVAGFANALLLAVLWFLYMSFVHVGQDWYGYGWEIQLLETGFLAIFLCPLLDMRPFPKRAPPMPVIGLFRWLIFRIMLGAGMIKIRGDEVWRNGTALYYHFETQPMPGPLSRWFHFLPRAILKTGVWYNFLAELVAPWFRLLAAPRTSYRGIRDRSFTDHPYPQRQPFFSQLADHRSRTGLFRRWLLVEDSSPFARSPGRSCRSGR